MQPSGPFPLLAVELVELIAESLDDNDLLEIRLVCSELQRKTFHYFAQRFFSLIRTDLSNDSLRRINAISHHAELRFHVHSLAFMLRNQNGVGHGLVWDRHPWGPVSAPLDVPVIRSLRNNLIHNLIHCRSFFIFCRYPEGHPDMSHFTITDVVAVFFALVDSYLPVSAFHLIYANSHSSPLLMDMRRLPKLIYHQPEFKLVWANLKKLSLEQRLTLDNFNFLLELVLGAPNIQTLGLNLGFHDMATEFMHELAEKANFPRLCDLALVRTAVRGPDLHKLLGNVRDNLTALELNRVTLVPGSDWTPFLQELCEAFPALHRISLYYLWASTPAKSLHNFQNIQKISSWCTSKDQDLYVHYSDDVQNPTILGVEYSGSKVSQILSLLQATS
ncbi:unnamed protein product [Penicillium salamii]|uniref:F-box domain-containing protein n=1 Tax=Penicillium salamii TaxID=1612424 RepID=A0A9W4NFB6_9EURO|nr:unnamed protein product [Penicillium salamii]CAG8298078.1 unnamed protein product [Penicillium salamii]CAG8346103.1 unnamed protein product [Penicillium salamii]CAG8355340.1 unnamed protein product [Penicillium salamii]CAG8369599.1 unnamed protein product [Penicillium salamii]